MVLQVLMDAPLRSIAGSVCNCWVLAALLCGTRNGTKEVPAAPTQCVRTFTWCSTTKLVHLLCFQGVCSQAHRKSVLFSAFRELLWDRIHLCCVFTHRHAPSLPSAPTQPRIWARSRERKVTLKPNHTRALIAPEWRYYGYFPTARTQPQNLSPRTMGIPWDFSVTGDSGRCDTLPLS